MPVKEISNKELWSEGDVNQWEESVYRIQLRQKWAFKRGDPRLTSMAARDEKKKPTFGKAIDTKEKEEED